jgi:carbon monoxide dehydrogenase subunit G
MAIRLDERFVVNAPVAPVWEFLVDPRRVVACVPGGELGAVVDERTWAGSVKVLVGPLTLGYGGRVRLADVDLAARRVRIVGEAREAAGGDRARMTLDSSLRPLPGGATEVVARARIDVAGRVVELGRGFLEQLGHVVFQEFAASVRLAIEAERASGVAPEPAAPLRAMPLVLRALRAWVAGWARGRAPAGQRGAAGSAAPEVEERRSETGG